MKTFFHASAVLLSLCAVVCFSGCGDSSSRDEQSLSEEEWNSRYEQPPNEEIQYYRNGAEQGDPQAQYNLGLCYYEGRGVYQNMTSAVKWFRKAAEQGFAEAQMSLGCCYDRGEGVKRDMRVAVQWYRKAAEQGVTHAQYNLGSCYACGDGVTQDKVEAVKWYRKAAEAGDPKAMEELKKLGE